MVGSEGRGGGSGCGGGERRSGHGDLGHEVGSEGERGKGEQRKRDKVQGVQAFPRRKTRTQEASTARSRRWSSGARASTRRRPSGAGRRVTGTGQVGRPSQVSGLLAFLSLSLFKFSLLFYFSVNVELY